MNQSTDMRAAIIPKSDQLNADDLMAGPITITITEARVTPGTEQPVAINFEGDNRKPYKPCKSMCRVLVQAWGADSSKYAGRGMTLFLDPTVKWGGMNVGGIRISHLSNIDKKLTIPLTATRGNKKPYSVEPLAAGQGNAQSDDERREAWVSGYIRQLDGCSTLEELTQLQTSQQERLDQIKDKYSALWDKIVEANSGTYNRLKDDDADDLEEFGQEVQE